MTGDGSFELDIEQECITALVVLIDPDSPPGLAAHELAWAIVNLVHDQGGIDALRISTAIDELAAKLGRPRGVPTVLEKGLPCPK